MNAEIQYKTYEYLKLRTDRPIDWSEAIDNAYTQTFKIDTRISSHINFFQKKVWSKRLNRCKFSHKVYGQV